MPNLKKNIMMTVTYYYEQSQTAVTAYFSSEQLLLFVFAGRIQYLYASGLTGMD